VRAEQTTLEALIDPGAPLTLLADGFQFTEGPVWSQAEGCLYFSDIPSDVRWRWSRSRGAEEVMRPAFKGNGLVLDVEGHLIACEHVTSSVVRYRSTGQREVLAYHHRGKYLNSPNDIVTRAADGSIYFTDPDYGRWNDWIGIKRTPELGFKGVYRVPKDGGEADLLVKKDEFDQPNGLCFSPDQTLLYINDSPRGHIKVFDVRSDGSLVNGRVFFEGVGMGMQGDENADLATRHAKLHASGAVDGMKCDELGNVWVTGPAGVWVITPNGRHLGVIEAPEVVGNLTFGGSGLHSLYLATSTTLHVVETRVASAPLPFHRT
jgi:gluconolactonase